MRIDSKLPVRAGAPEKKARAASAGASDFARLLQGAAAGESFAAQEAEAAAPPSALAGMLALQEVSDEEIRRKKAVRGGHRMLDALESLRLSLLFGEVPPDQLEIIARRMEEQKRLTADPRLAAIMREIELRAAVELAKFGR